MGILHAKTLIVRYFSILRYLKCQN